jgi:rare lipoprotein A
MMIKSLACIGAVLLLSACGGLPKTVPGGAPASEPRAPGVKPPAQSSKKGGGYYLDDGPHEDIPVRLEEVADAVPRYEPISRAASRPYTVFGKTYTPLDAQAPYRARGIASWYGRRFHGNKTSSGEPYDMYAMTAAHPVLPIPSYVRVTHMGNGKSVVVRVNDRGPFLHDRIIDLSYVAAWKLGYVGPGSAQVLVERIWPGQEAVAAQKEAAPLSAGTALQTGYYLQLGAFSNPENAQAFRQRIEATLDEQEAGGEKVAMPGIVIQEFNPVIRVQAGPFTDAARARQAAQRFRALFDFEPFVVKR